MPIFLYQYLLLHLMELVRYIHLNPLHAKLVTDDKSLKSYRYAGHSALKDECANEWQNTEYILSRFGAETGLKEMIVS